MQRERERERERDLQFTVRISPIIPALGNDDVVHVSVSKDDPRKGAPRPPKVKSA
jgi:hypothetical protein